MKIKNYLIIALLIVSSIGYSQTGTTISGSFMSGGVSRTYTYYVPNSYNGSTAFPMVINLHGLSGSSSKQENYQDFRKIADSEKFIVLHPEGTGEISFLVVWGSMGTVSAAEADRAYLMRLMDTIETNVNIDCN